MPLYECSKCHAVENTALTNFWWKTNGEGAPALCSECDPGIGVWHGRFPKITVAEYRAQNGNGNGKVDHGIKPKLDFHVAQPRPADAEMPRFEIKRGEK